MVISQMRAATTAASLFWFYNYFTRTKHTMSAVGWLTQAVRDCDVGRSSSNSMLCSYSAEFCTHNGNIERTEKEIRIS